MGSTSESVIGTMPLHYDYQMVGWVAALQSHKLRNLNVTTGFDNTFYIDSVSGDDGDDGTTTGTAVQGLSRLHDLVNGASGSVYIRVKRGSEFTGLGKNYEWVTDHDAACFVNTDFRIDTYGSGNAPYFHSGGNIADSWTQDGANDSWYADATGFGGVEAVYSHVAGGTTGRDATVFSKAADLSGCNSTAQSFWYDSGNTRIYVNTDGTSPGANL